MPAPSLAVAASSTHAENEVFVGASSVDITPPPGVATFGHGPDARVAAGYMTHLRCRAFVFLAEGAAPPTAIVPCELAAVSTLLQRRVAARLRDAGIGLPPQRLFVSAIHTHAGPAHYFDAEFFGGAASSQGPGFDPRVVEFLAGRMAAGVRAAYLAAREARAAHRPARLRWIHGQKWGLARNRSLDAFVLNSPRMVHTPPPEAKRGLDPASLAIDPSMDLLEIVEGSEDKPIPVGWLGFLALHPTVLANTNRHLGADLFGVASVLLEQELRRWAAESGAPGQAPVVGLVNTNEGDMVPRWSTGDRGEMITLGRRLAEALLEVRAAGSATPYRTRSALASSYIEVRLPGNDFGLPAGARLCDSAEFGVAGLWGAADHPTSLAVLSSAAASPRAPERDGCQAPKRRALGWLQSLIASPGAFPVTVPLGLARVDDTWIAFAPAELTATAGWRIRQKLTSLLPRAEDGRPMQAQIGGLTNGYMEYVATEEEYQLQRYEGASTLYGPHVAEFLKATYASMAERMLGQASPLPRGSSLDVATDFEFRTGPRRDRLADTAAPRARPTGLAVCRLPALQAGGAPRFCFRWVDGPPNVSSSPPRRAVSLVPVDAGWQQLTVRALVEPALAPSTVPDPLLQTTDALLRDDGFEFVTTVHSRTTTGWIWSTLFVPTSEEWSKLGGQTQRFVFQVGDARTGPAVRSRSFVFGQGNHAPRDCPLETARSCEGGP